MKKYLLTFLLAIVIFAALTYVSVNDKRPVDGPYYVGFPLAFYIKYSEMTSPSPISSADMSITKYWFLILDILFAILLSAITLKIFRFGQGKKSRK